MPRTSLTIPALLLSLFASTQAFAAAAPEDSPARAKSEELDAASRALELELQAAQKAYATTIQDLRARNVPPESWPPSPSIDFYFRFEEIAAQGHPESARWCLLNVSVMGFPPDELALRRQELFTQVLTLGADREWVTGIAQMLGGEAMQGQFDLAIASKLLGDLEQRSSLAETKACAAYALGEALAGLKSGASLERAKPHFRRAAEQYAATQFGTRARSRLFQLENLVVGKVVPDFSSPDAEGAEIKLSDYRGKVVLISFWGYWCAPCVALLPAEIALVKKHEGKPFAILGVNTDTDKEMFLRETRSRGLPWRNAWQGGTNGPIPTLWGVARYPTTYLLDAKGVLRYVNVKGAELDRAVDVLMAELAAPPQAVK